MTAPSRTGTFVLSPAEDGFRSSFVRASVQFGPHDVGLRNFGPFQKMRYPRQGSSGRRTDIGLTRTRRALFADIRIAGILATITRRLRWF